MSNAEQQGVESANDSEPLHSKGVRPQFRLLAAAILMGALLVLMAAVMFAVVSQVGFTHLACKMEEDTLGSALSHARTLVRDLQISSGILQEDSSGAVGVNAAALRAHLQAQAKDDPAMLYAMVVSQSGRILVHTHETPEGLQAWEVAGGTVPPLGSFGEFPGGRFGFDEFVYEVRVPFDADPWRGHALVLGLSKARIGRHIEDVRRGMGLRMLWAFGLGLVILAVPTGGLWFALRRYRLLAKRSQQVAHLAQMGEIAKGLAHEIRNPLNAVRFNLKIVEEEMDNFPPEMRDGYRQLIQRAGAEVGRVDEMLTEYLNYVRPGRPQAAWHDLNAIVESVLAFLDYECRRHNIAIHRELSPNLLKVLVDEKQIRQTVLNVVLNAQQVLRAKGGHIGVRTFLKGGMIVLEVQDDGPGIPDEDREKIFEPFFSKREGGTGLGLAIARRVVEDHGGTILCRSKPGHGATFVMTFPQSKVASRHQEAHSP